MADYLSKLVDRTLGRLPVARPLIPPLYAAGPVLAANTGGAREIESGEPAADAPEQSHRAAQHPHTAAASSVHPQPPAARSQLLPPAAVPQPLRIPPPVPGGPTLVPQAHAAPPVARSAPVGEPAVPSELPAMEAHHAFESQRPTPGPANQLLPAWQGEPALLSSTGRAAQPPLPGSEPRLPEATPADQLPDAPRQGLASGLGPRAANAEWITPAPPAPTIQVSIGRVEVRAVLRQSASTAPAAAAARPKISLEEYLGTNKGGSR